jgi:hypothetical protein
MTQTQIIIALALRGLAVACATAGFALLVSLLH